MSRAGTTITPLDIAGACLLNGVRHTDGRGDLRKVLEVDAARDGGVEIIVDEVITTTNALRGTVRGLHYQSAPCEQSKTLWVTQGAVFDVILDLRRDQPTYGAWIGVHLSATDDLALHVPPGVAHGYQTLKDDSAVTYLIGGMFSADHARTLRWDDPTIDVAWPQPVSRISESDLGGMAWPPPSSS